MTRLRLSPGQARNLAHAFEDEGFREYANELRVVSDAAVRQHRPVTLEVSTVDTGPLVTLYRLSVEGVDGAMSDDTIERVVEDIRGYAFPKVWGLQGNGPGKAPTFVCDFEVRDTERETHEYVADIRDSMLSWFGVSFTIEQIERAT